MTKTTKGLLGVFFISIAAFILGTCKTDGHLGDTDRGDIDIENREEPPHCASGRARDTGDIEIENREEPQKQARQEPQSPTSGAGQQAKPGSCALKCGKRCEVVAVSEKSAETGRCAKRPISPSIGAGKRMDAPGKKDV
jgi:hypothetical protein